MSVLRFEQGDSMGFGELGTKGANAGSNVETFSGVSSCLTVVGGGSGVLAIVGVLGLELC